MKDPTQVERTTDAKTLLLIEDDEMLLELLTTLLGGLGYRLLVATDGVDALELYKQRREDIALVLSDMGLPTLGGWETFHEMKKIDPKVKLIFVSGYMDEQLRAKIFEAGALDFIQKPYDPEVIGEKVRRAIEM